MKQVAPGRPKSKTTKKLCAFRLSPEYVGLINRLAIKTKLTQAQIIERALNLHAKEIKL